MAEVITKKVVARASDLNQDPISGPTGTHPLGTGAASDGVAGAAVAINPTAEEAFWKETYNGEPYYVEGRSFEDYAPGYRTGWEGRVSHDGRTFEQAEPELKAAYEVVTSELGSSWQDARPAARAAWNRVDLYWKVGQ